MNEIQDIFKEFIHKILTRKNIRHRWQHTQEKSSNSEKHRSKMASVNGAFASYNCGIVACAGDCARHSTTPVSRTHRCTFPT